MLTKHPATTTVTHHPVDLANHQAKVLDRLQANDLPAQVWTVSFPNTRSTGPAGNGYNETAAVMDDLAKQQPGYIGIDSVRGEDGVGITVSRWTSIAAMVAWRKVVSHAEAQHAGRDRWYTWYRSDVARVDRTSEFNR
jgi:heme-degrading monooxygenase HmoA